MRIPLVEEGATIVYIAPVGAGESDDMPDGDYAMHTYVHFVDAVVDHLGVPEISFMGHSHGAMVGLQYGLDHPGKLAGLLLYDGAPVYGPDLTAEADTQVQKFAERHAGHPGLDAVLKVRAQGLKSVRDKAGLTSYMQGVLPLYFKDFWAMEENLKPWLAVRENEAGPPLFPHNWDVRGKLGALDVPTLIMAGRHDFICSVSWADEMHAEIPASRVAVLEESGHFAHVEQPKEFARTVLDFLH
jgi:pimeloyl-ACP methyl ester carboxylesterase